MASTFYRRRLPHVRVDGAIYFVTWRLHPNQPELSDQECACIAAAIRHFADARYILHAWVVMNDHVHVLVEPCPGHILEDMVQSWKSFTANRMQRSHGRRGTVWQAEYFDRVVRDDLEYDRKRDYILNNPAKRWPEIGDYRWRWAIGLD
jgi:REP element-mobilizing transposase RayT